MLSLKSKVRATLLLLPLSVGFGASTDAIGVATANGKFSLNHANHNNNATLFEGNTFDSGASELEFRLASDTIVQLGAAARGTIYHDRIVITDGGGDVRPGSTYSVEALTLQVKSTDKGTVARVVVSGGQVRVGALRGKLQVYNGKGVLVASIAQGDGDAFTPQNGKIEAMTAEGTKATQKTAAAAAASGVAAGTAAAGTGAAAGTAGAVAAGAATAAGLSTAMIVAGVAVVGVGAAAGISVAATSGNGNTTLSPAAR